MFFILIAGIVSLTVLNHYFFLSNAAKWLPRLNVPHQFRIIVVVMTGLTAHLLEIIMFAFAYYSIEATQRWGHFAGDFNGTFSDCIYYSAITYTTLGFGDIVPIGLLRFLTAIEALTGLILIAWTATFIYNQVTARPPKEQKK